MNHIRIRAGLFITSLAGVVIPKTINGGIPKRAVEFYEGGFDGANHVRACVLKNYEPAHEIIGVEIRGELQAVVMLAQAAAKFTRLILRVVGSARLPPTFRHGFAHVNRKLISRAIELSISRVKRIRAGVINRINAPPQKRDCRWQSKNRRAVEKPDGIFDQLRERVVSINVLRSIKWPLFHCEYGDIADGKCAREIYQRQSAFVAGETPALLSRLARAQFLPTIQSQ